MTDWKPNYVPYILEDIEKAQKMLHDSLGKVRNGDARFAMCEAISALDAAKGVLRQVSEGSVSNIVGWDRAVILARQIIECDERYNKQCKE